jgi:hypothetical protein
MMFVMASALLVAGRRPSGQSEIDSVGPAPVNGAVQALGMLYAAPADTPADITLPAGTQHGDAAASATLEVSTSLASARRAPKTMPALETNVGELPPVVALAVLPSASQAPAFATRPLVETSDPVSGPSALGTPGTSQEEGLVTITGCLEADDEAFRLKDTTGADAPKSRSWRTGFLTRRSASIAVLAATDGTSLPAHVGQRVALTGKLVDREMRVRSLRRLASCDEKT